MALCRYRLKQYSEAIKRLAEIIERGIREHPDLSVGMATEGIDVRSVGNTRVLHETALVEAFNLKAAIEYDLRNRKCACEMRDKGGVGTKRHAPTVRAGRPRQPFLPPPLPRRCGH